MAPSSPSLIDRLFASKQFPVVIACLLLLPHCIKGRPYDVRLGLPLVYSGDEPHYLVIVNSLISDGDLDLSNNYEAVHHGSLDAGQLWSESRVLDHHTYFRFPDRLVNWREIYSPISFHGQGWEVDSFGRFYRVPHAGCEPVPPGIPEYSTHQPGIAFMLAPVLWPFRNTIYVEAIAVLCSGLAVVGAFLMFRSILRKYSHDAAAINLTSTTAFLGTTAWFYGRSFFMESFLLCFVVGSVLCHVRFARPFWSGAFLALAVQLKAYYALCGLPFFADHFLRRDWGSLIRFTSPLLLSVAGFCIQNALFFGSPWHSAQPFLWGNPIESAIGLWFSWKWGILLFSPVIIIALWAWPNWYRAFPRDAILVGSLFLLNYALIACYAVWSAGNCVGPRYLTPFLPLLCIPLVAEKNDPLQSSWAKWLLFVGLFWLSIFANANAAIRHFRYWETSPIVEAYHYLHEKWQIMRAR